VPVDGAREVVFSGASNKRDPTTFLIDDVQLIACAGGRAAYPVLVVAPVAGPPGTVFEGKGGGFRDGEQVTHWLTELATGLRYDQGVATALPEGYIQIGVRPPATPGLWRWHAVGSQSQLPGMASFTLTSSP
jgi:hypothetical protein